MPVFVCCGRTFHSFVRAGRCWDVFCFKICDPEKVGIHFTKMPQTTFWRFRCLIFCLRIGQIEFLEGDVGCPSSVHKDACAEPLMKSCFRKIFWIPVWYPPNRNEQRWYKFKCFNTSQLYCVLLAFSSCIFYSKSIWLLDILLTYLNKKRTFLTPVLLLREEGSPEDASCCLSRCRFFGAEIAGCENENWWTMMIVYDSWW